jgi:hypothetical protein
MFHKSGQRTGKAMFSDDDDDTTHNVLHDSRPPTPACWALGSARYSDLRAIFLHESFCKLLCSTMSASMILSRPHIVVLAL